LGFGFQYSLLGNCLWKDKTFMNEETITITKKEYDSLKEDAKFMRALEAAGVDNWEGYDFALDAMKERKDEKTKAETNITLGFLNKT